MAAGLLCGWTARRRPAPLQAGDRNSTGSIDAPFAFLGPAYDAKLKEIYTTIETKDVYRLRGLLKMLRSDSLADTWPLAKLAASYVNDQMLADIAAEHKKGRRLLIGTTNLDAQRLVIWDMGAIASSGHPDAGKLFRQIMLASAAMPVMFPPQYIEVEAGGKRYDELHVDGGTVAEAITYEFTFRPSDVKTLARGQSAKPRPIRLYVIRNSKTKPEWATTEAGLKSILQTGHGHHYQVPGGGRPLPDLCLEPGGRVDFNLAVIPGDFIVARQEEFDRNYMNQLFDRGYDLGRRGTPGRNSRQGCSRVVSPKPGK